uniref:Acetyl-coenzyme A carboxylase carboxyl transferase subunit beta, chloroplastic n=1 Tax=Parasitaxus usta TaxID=56899 RepID=A0A5J6CE21_9CONI|nr:acetyl-CoA carboxylase carboxyltransferase beta subunit [Parasitaxus usta]QEQ14282.1 acetyl-CoA carboxylase carboxyltransferase beta subunit [Parasitaxus usta]
MTLREWHEDRRRINRVIEDLTEKANDLAIVKDGDKNTEHPQLVDNERLRQLWAQCDNCYNMQFIKFWRQNMSICQDCGFPMQMSSSDRIELLVDPGTWFPMDENICTVDVFSEFENLKNEEEIPWQINRKNSQNLIDYSWNLWIYYSFLLKFIPQIENFLLIEKFSEEIDELFIDEIWMEDIEYTENSMQQDIFSIENLMTDLQYLEEKSINSSSFNKIQEWKNNKEIFLIFRRYLKQILMSFTINCFQEHISILENINIESWELQSFKDELQGILLYGNLINSIGSSSIDLFPDPFQFWDEFKSLWVACIWKNPLEQYIEDSEKEIRFEESPSFPKEELLYLDLEESPSFPEEELLYLDLEESPSFPEEEEVPEDFFSEQFLKDILVCGEQSREIKVALEIQKLYYSIIRENRKREEEEERKREEEEERKREEEEESKREEEEESKKEEEVPEEEVPEEESPSFPEEELLYLDLEEKPYMDHITSYQIDTGLTDAIQTGIGRLNGIPIAIGVMDFEFVGGTMGSVVGEKMTRLIEYATNKYLPLITVCASGGARMQEGSFSLMQMGKIASALNIYQRKKKLFYISILTSPTTGGVTASFAMLPNITIAEPKAYIAFAGRRVIEQTLNLTIEDEDFQTAEYLFHHGLFDLIVPRSLLKGVLSDILKLYKFR